MDHRPNPHHRRGRCTFATLLLYFLTILINTDQQTGFTFTPNALSVAVGTVVEFNFYPGNHSVARSAYKFPCIPYENTGPNLVGFFSDFQDTNVYSTDGPKYRILVNNTEPIFYYCSAPSSCIGHGMIGVINPVCIR